MLYSKKFRTIKSDSELVQKYQDSHDAAAFEELFQRYCHLIYGTCLKYLANEEDSKDAVLEIFEKILTRLKIHHVSNFKSWLYTITKNYCLYKLRTNKEKEVTHLKKNGEFQKIFMEFDYFDTLISSKEIQEKKLHAAINQLNEAQSCCIRLFYFEGKSYEAISRETGYDIKKVKSNIQNGKRNLKNLLTQKEVFRDEE